MQANRVRKQIVMDARERGMMANEKEVDKIIEKIEKDAKDLKKHKPLHSAEHAKNMLKRIFPKETPAHLEDYHGVGH